MSKQSILWVGHPARGDIAQLVNAGMAVTVVASLFEVESPVEPVVVLLGEAIPDDVYWLRRRFRSAPVVIALAASEHALPLLRAGAHEVVSSAIGMEELVLRVRRGVESTRKRRRMHELASCVRSLEAELAEMRRAQDQLRTAALSDELTGLGNRRAFRERLELWLAFVERHGGHLSLVAIDLDDFKAVNDGRGHAAGDALLRSVADALRHSIRAIDHAARPGGDEFSLVLPTTDLDQARQVAERIRVALPASASFGVASASGAQRSLAADELAARADAALYRAKQMGKARVEVEPRVLHAADYRTIA